MHWIAPSEKDTATETLEKRLWDAADQFRANSGLKAQEYSAPVLGLIFLRFAIRTRDAGENEYPHSQPLRLAAPSTHGGCAGQFFVAVARASARIVLRRRLHVDQSLVNRLTNNRLMKRKSVLT
jgi:hypothetical protein